MIISFGQRYDKFWKMNGFLLFYYVYQEKNVNLRVSYIIINSYMKKFIFLGIFALVVLMTGCTDKPVVPAQLPPQITAFMQQNFPGQTISFATKDLEITGWQYDVVLADGTQIDFDTDKM